MSTTFYPFLPTFSDENLKNFIQLIITTRFLLHLFMQASSYSKQFNQCNFMKNELA